MHVFDIESDGLLEDVTTVHCINVIDRFTGRSYAFNSGTYADGSFAPHDGTIEDGLRMLEEAECIAGQKIIEYDIPALKKLFPKWNPKGRIFDSLPMSRVICAWAASQAGSANVAMTSRRSIVAEGGWYPEAYAVRSRCWTGEFASAFR